MAQSLAGSWDALLAALQGLFPVDPAAPAAVVGGELGDYQPDLTVAIGEMRVASTQPTGGTRRTRDKRAEIDVHISKYVFGGPEAQAPANDAAWAAHDKIEDYFRVNPNEQLGGACYNAFVAGATMRPDVAYSENEDDDEVVPTGRICEIDVVVEVWVRRS